MLLDFEVKACTRCCVETGKILQPGEVYFSVLEVQEAETVRRDYSAEAWQEPASTSLGWWRSRVPTKDEKPKLAPTEVMLKLLTVLAGKPAEAQFRYVLGLLLIRRRVLKREGAICNQEGQEVLALVAPKHDQQFELIVAEPDFEQAARIQQQMVDLLYGDGPYSDRDIQVPSAVPPSSKSAVA